MFTIKNALGNASESSKFRFESSLKEYEKSCGPMSAKRRKKVIKKFEDTGSLEVNSSRGKKSNASM